MINKKSPYLQAFPLPIGIMSLQSPCTAAQNDEGSVRKESQIEKVIITARRREESMQDTPIAVEPIGQQGEEFRWKKPVFKTGLIKIN